MMRYRGVLTAPLVVALVGCAGADFLTWSKGELPRADAQRPAAEILCVWEAAEGTGIDGVPTRGFAGKIMFFTRGSASPVAVDGDVRIFVFDNHGEDPGKPLHQFDFPSDVWNLHLQNSMVGPAYNVFIPYTRPGNDEARCSLRVRLSPPSGPTVYSGAAEVLLPGPNREGDPTGTPSVRDEYEVTTTTEPASAVADRLRVSASARAEAAQGLDRRVTKIDLARKDGASAARIEELERQLQQLIAEKEPSAAPTETEEARSKRFQLTSATADETPAPAWIDAAALLEEGPAPSVGRAGDASPHPLAGGHAETSTHPLAP